MDVFCPEELAKEGKVHADSLRNLSIKPLSGYVLGAPATYSYVKERLHSAAMSTKAGPWNR